MVSDAVVVFDNLAGKIHAIVLADPSEENAYERGQARLEELLERLRQPVTPRRASTSRRPRVVSRRFVPASPARTMKTR